MAGKFFRDGAGKAFLRGISYGPFRPNAQGEPFPEPEVLASDLAHIKAMGFDTVRLYDLPSEPLLSAAQSLGLRLLIGIPWTDHVDFLGSARQRREIEQRIIQTVRSLRGHPCIAAFLIGNEIEKTLVRWMGPVRVQRFLERLITLARHEAPEHLFSYATYPSTEYLIPRNADFLAVNLYLEQAEALAAYLQRLQNLAGNKPLVISEFGLDAGSHGEQAQAEAMIWLYRCAVQTGVAGSIWFSYTDEWFRGGKEVTQWHFGLVDARRGPRAACEAALRIHTFTPPKLGSVPRISVIVCTYNGTATLGECLASLGRLNYPDYEVLLIDDGSTRDIAALARGYPWVVYHRQEHAGLSVARNLGASLAGGSILAYTDDDCLADEDWLNYLAAAFEDPQWVAAGGPNIAPAPRNRMEAVVAAAPGAPAHVLLNDVEAEHLPGCNFAVRKEALAKINGFHAPFKTAGDDVDICWRLRDAGGKLCFVPGAMVWHHRRFTAGAYLRQQRGYGSAEALLMAVHPERFGPLGGARWRGAIYGDRHSGESPVEGAIFHGPFGNGLFQGIYSADSRCLLDWMGGVLWVALMFVALLLRQPGAAFGIGVFSAVLAACRLRHLPVFPFVLRLHEKLLLLLLCWLQPVVREGARVTGMIRLHARPSCKPPLREVFIPKRPRKWALPMGEMAFWSDQGVCREELLKQLQMLFSVQRMPVRLDDGWRLFDIELRPEAGLSSAIVTATEYHSGTQCLTRVRILVRLSFRLALFMVLFMALLAALILRLPHPWNIPCMAMAAILSATILTLPLGLKMMAVQAILAAAQAAALTLIEKKPNPP